MKGIVRKMILILKIIKPCKHVFRPCDMQPRDNEGMVTWPCSKCGKVFTEPYGLKILENGTCEGNWIN